MSDGSVRSNSERTLAHVMAVFGQTQRQADMLVWCLVVCLRVCWCVRDSSWICGGTFFAISLLSASASFNTTRRTRLRRRRRPAPQPKHAVDSYAFRNAVAVAGFVAGAAAGKLGRMPGLLNVSLTAGVLWGLQKLTEVRLLGLPWQVGSLCADAYPMICVACLSNAGVHRCLCILCVLQLGLFTSSAAGYYVALWLRSHPEFLVPAKSLLKRADK